jgi:hypothetical protein
MFRKKDNSLEIGQLDKRLGDLDYHLHQIRQVQVDDYLLRYLYSNPRYQQGKRLNRFEYQVFSQFGEDGMIAEIYNRIGTTNRYFIEFGVENGTECNTTNLLLKDWKGLWIEANEGHVATIKSSLQKKISENSLEVLNSFITAENIEELLNSANVPQEPDLLSIDIDRNDYYVWQRITKYRPRVVIIEYNAIFRPGDRFIVPYDAHAAWDGSSHFGASLQSYYELGLEKGYHLVGCTFSGVNAFFVRQDLVEDHFHSPFTPEEHYESPRYFLYTKNGHYRKLDH